MSTTSTAYADERVLLLKRLRAEAQGTSLADLFRPAAQELRFRLGTSLADLRIPFRLGDDLRAAAQTATIDAYLLVAQRHRPALPAAEFDKLLLMPAYDPSALRAATYAPPSTVTREHVRRTFHDAAEAHPGLDAGLAASFLGTNRPGRGLTAAFHAVFAKARDEAARSDVGESTPFLAALMLRPLAEGCQLLLRDAPIGEPAARWLRGATAALLAQALLLAHRELGLPRDAGLVRTTPVTGPGVAPIRDPRESRSALLAIATLGLLPFLGARGSLAGTGVTAYGLGFDATPPRLEELVARLTQGDEPEQLVRELSASFTKEKELQRRMERAAAFAALRSNLRELARQLETARGYSFTLPQDGNIPKLLSIRDALEKLVGHEGRRKEAAQRARDGAKQAPPPIGERLEAFAHALREWREDEPAAWLGASEARHAAAKAVVALAADLAIDRQAAGAAQLLLERTGAETEGGTEAEYHEGRLYHVSAEPGPLLQARMKAAEVGHLFCDMKDFTRRTTFLKESVIADFLQREFYTPILTAASGLDVGARAPGANRPIALNNLLGDALSFCGDIVGLVQLTHEIRAALRDYGRRLDLEASQDAVTQRVRDLESRHRVRRDALERNARELAARAQTAAPHMRDAMTLRAQELKLELVRQEALFQSELARAAGEKLEAGIFLSYGAAPVVARFDDATFGPIKVAIAEKINESARGTARSGAVRERAEMLLARSRRVGNHERTLPFHVFVDTPPSLAVGAEQGIILRELLERGDEARAEALLVDIARRALARLGSGPGEIYNGGAALSEEALRAYIEARGADIQVVRREVLVDDLHPALRDRFFFPKLRLSVVACTTQNGRNLSELFIYQGSVLFKGFEATGGLGVWELTDPGEPFFQIFAREQLPAWNR